MNRLHVLIACEFSGIVRDAFLKRGHDAWSCDLLPTEKPGPHIQDDVLKHLDDGWDLMIAHPPCKYLSRAGARWFTSQPDRIQKREEAMLFFMNLWNASIKKVCLENPIGYPFTAFRHPDQKIQPWYFGHPYSKATCLWLRNLPPLMSTLIVGNYSSLLPSNTGRGKRLGQKWQSGSVHNAKEASRTFQGVANAMAEQWG